MVSNLLFLQEILLSIAVGALIGVEREHTKHQIITGVRTIALISLLGTLSVMISKLASNLIYVPYLCLLAVIGCTFLLYYFRAKKLEAIGMTTVLTLPLAFILGIMIGFDLYIEAISGAILTTILLLSRDYSHLFVKKLTDAEIADAMLFGIICFIIYPIAFVMSPPTPVILYGGFSINLQSFLFVVIIVSLISFISFLLLRFWGQKALPLTGFLGGVDKFRCNSCSPCLKIKREAVASVYNEPCNCKQRNATEKPLPCPAPLPADILHGFPTIAGNGVCPAYSSPDKHAAFKSPQD